MSDMIEFTTIVAYIVGVFTPIGLIILWAVYMAWTEPEPLVWADDDDDDDSPEWGDET